MYLVFFCLKVISPWWCSCCCCCTTQHCKFSSLIYSSFLCIFLFGLVVCMHNNYKVLWCNSYCHPGTKGPIFPLTYWPYELHLVEIRHYQSSVQGHRKHSLESFLMVLYLYCAFLVLMTTQSSLQYSFTFTQSHTHSYSASISASQLCCCPMRHNSGLLKDTLACRFELPTFRLEDDHSTTSATAALISIIQNRIIWFQMLVVVSLWNCSVCGGEPCLGGWQGGGVWVSVWIKKLLGLMRGCCVVVWKNSETLKN